MSLTNYDRARAWRLMMRRLRAARDAAVKHARTMQGTPNEIAEAEGAADGLERAVFVAMNALRDTKAEQAVMTDAEIAARCPRCDRAECPWPAAWKAAEGQPGFGMEQTPESEAAWIALGRAALKCDEKPTAYWRTEAISARATLTAQAEALAEARRELDEARAVALEACDLAEEGWGYASEHFRDKWDSGNRLADLRMALTAGGKP